MRLFREAIYVFENFENPLKFLYQYITGRKFVVKVNGVSFEGKRGDGLINNLSRLAREEITLLERDDGFFKFEKKFKGNKINFWSRDILPWEDDFYEYMKYCNSIDEDTNFLDIGGFQGISTVILSNTLDPDYIGVYEPLPENVEMIELNEDNLNFKGEFDVFQKAVTQSNESINIESSTSVSSSSFGLEEGEFSIEVQSTTWESVLSLADEKEVSLIKLDIEGYEENLLQIDSELLKKVDKWLIEVHSEELAVELSDMFADSGFTKRKLREENESVYTGKQIYLLAFEL